MQMMSREAWLATIPSHRIKPYTAEQQAEIALRFPNVDPGVIPFGQRVLVQIRLERKYTNSGIVLPGETQNTERWNESVAQLIAIGPLAFLKRDTLQPWGEGQWAQIGDFIRVPRFGGDRWEVPTPDMEALERRQAQKEQLEVQIASMKKYPPMIEKSSVFGLSQKEEEQIYRWQQELKTLASEPPPIQVMFAMFNDYEIIGLLTGNPVDMKVYV